MDYSNNRLSRGAAAILLAGALSLGLEGAYRLLWTAWTLCQRAGAPAHVFEIYGVGESTMAGEPYPGLSPPDLVASMFEGRIGDRPIRIVNLARRGESIYPQAERLARRLAWREKTNPGVVLIYCGHNDPGRPGGTSFFEYLKEDFLFRSRLVSDALYLAERGGLIPRIRGLHTYEYHLRRVIEISRENGLVPILSTVVSNASGIDPGLEARPGGLTPYDLRAVIRAGEEMEARKQYRLAIAHYKRFLGVRELRPYLMFEIARCRWELRDYGRARWYYLQAVDLDYPDDFMRATSSQNDLIRRLAREYRIPLVDSVALFEARSPGGVTGEGLFADGHHPNIRGQLLLAQAFARQVSAVTGEPILWQPPAEGDASRIFAALSYPVNNQVEALLNSGRWLFSVCARQLLPSRRLTISRQDFESALALEPGDFSATLGLGLVDAASRGDFLLKEENLRWLDEEHLLYGSRYYVPERELAGIVAKLAQAGVPAPRLDQIELAFRRRGYQ